MEHLSNPEKRYTLDDAMRVTKILASALGKKFSETLSGCYETDPKTGKVKTIVGCWFLDYNPVYGGVVIYEMANEEGAQRAPFGYTRRPIKEFVYTVNFALEVLNYIRYYKLKIWES
jgi:hypothetical protein